MVFQQHFGRNAPTIYKINIHRKRIVDHHRWFLLGDIHSATTQKVAKRLFSFLGRFRLRG
jgi:hypothetical protein